MDCVISPSMWVSCNELDLLLLFLILFACKSVIVLLTWNVRLAFGALVTQHEIMNLRLFMLCVKIRKYETFSIRSNSAMRKEGVKKCKDL